MFEMFLSGVGFGNRLKQIRDMDHLRNYRHEMDWNCANSTGYICLPSLVFRHSSFYATQKTLLQSHKLLHKSAVKRIVGRAYWIYMLNNVLNIVASMAQAKWFGKRCLVRLERLKAIFASVATPDCCLPIHMDEETQPSNPCTSSRMAKWHSNLQSVHVTARSYPWIYPCHSLCQGTERPSTRRLMPQGAEKLWKNGKAESHWGSSSQIWLNKYE